MVSDFEPAGDQPKAIAALAEGIERGDRFQTLLGITGSGKSATIAWTIEQVQRPTLVLAPNKALAAQLADASLDEENFKTSVVDNVIEKVQAPRDTAIEIEYIEHGGVLHYVLRDLAKAPVAAE